MTENEIVEAYLKTSLGKQTLQKIVKQSQHIQTLEKKLLEISARNHELEEKLSLIDDGTNLPLTSDEEVAARQLMENIQSAYKHGKVNQYLLSIVDENGNEKRIYSQQMDELLSEVALLQDDF